jgi:rhamnulokinase
MIGKIQRKCLEWRQPVPETPGEITRCIKEGLAFSYRRTLDWIEKEVGFSIPSVHIIGGGAKSDLLNQFAASAMDRVVLAGPFEAAAAGNLCVQFISAGEIDGLDAARRILRSSFEVKEFNPKWGSGWENAYSHYLGISKGQ